MRLVGATDRFIKIPFYIQGLALGALGGIIGISSLFFAFQFVAKRFNRGFSTEILDVHFLPITTSAIIIAGSMLIGWIGCYLSLKQFLKV
jgi:cell division transport system permease protein